ncbi:MAG: hypothetical protein IH621_18440 [Krumholzibacteria bacterium]|nr:hypothetical protein [Candidatus Krumholzibacteria bacterium]
MSRENWINRIIDSSQYSPNTFTGDKDKGLVGAVTPESAVVSPFAPQTGNGRATGENQKP